MVKEDKVNTASNENYAAQIFSILREIKIAYVDYQDILIINNTKEELEDTDKEQVKQATSIIRKWIGLANIEYETLKSSKRIQQNERYEKVLNDYNTEKDQPKIKTIEEIVISLNLIVIEEILPEMFSKQAKL